MATTTIRIRKTAGGTCKVTSPAYVSSADEIAWVNETDDRVILFFPHDKVLGRPTMKRNFKKSIKKNGTFVIRGPRASTPKKSYVYSVYCQATERFGVGGSDPEIIVT